MIVLTNIVLVISLLLSVLALGSEGPHVLGRAMQ
jgi:hypothetical protein